MSVIWLPFCWNGTTSRKAKRNCTPGSATRNSLSSSISSRSIRSWRVSPSPEVDMSPCSFVVLSPSRRWCAARARVVLRRPCRAQAPVPCSGAVAQGGPLAGLERLDLAVLRRGRRDEGVEQSGRHGGHLGDGAVERLGVGPRRLGGPADLADELQCR